MIERYVSDGSIKNQSILSMKFVLFVYLYLLSFIIKYKTLKRPKICLKYILKYFDKNLIKLNSCRSFLKN